MIEIETKLRRWGNSFGIVIPINKIEGHSLKEGSIIKSTILKKDDENILRRTFGKAKFKKSTEQMMGETDKELYDI